MMFSTNDFDFFLTIDWTLLPILLLAQISPVNPLYRRAALLGRPRWSDLPFLSLGMQQHFQPSTINNGEYPACAAMTTGYVFRVENQATVAYLQDIGKTGCLTTLAVESQPDSQPFGRRTKGWDLVLYMPLGLILCLVMWSEPCFDGLALVSLGLLWLSRFLSIAFLRRQTASWHGASEHGVDGDLLILLSQDRWVRMRGTVDDLKAVTSGSWLREGEADNLGQVLDTTSRLSVYMAMLVLSGANTALKLQLLLVVFLSHLILSWRNRQMREELSMKGRTIRRERKDGFGLVRKYSRRLDMAKELIEETGRNDWAIRLGMINPSGNPILKDSLEL